VNWDALPFDQENLEKYLSSLYQEQMHMVTVRELGAGDELKGTVMAHLIGPAFWFAMSLAACRIVTDFVSLFRILVH
jgi:hypothetical protein